MKKFLVERALPGVGNLYPEELQTISRACCKAAEDLGKPFYWIESFITGEKIYCIHIAESEEVIREHSRLGKFPINSIVEVKSMIDTITCDA